MTLVDGTRAAAPPQRVHAARPDDAPRLALALAGAFADDPVFRWFSPDDTRRAAMLPAFFAVFVEAFMRHGEVYTGDAAAGAALWSAPGVEPIGVEPAYAERLAEIAGLDAARAVRGRGTARGARADRAARPPAVPRRGA